MIRVDLKQHISNLEGKGLLNRSQIRELAATGFPNTLAAFQNMIDYARQYWAEAAMGKHFDGHFRLRRQYANAIMASSAWDYPSGGDPWHAIITPDQRIAAIAELEVQPFDMKPGILAGPNALRFDKEGGHYKFIPFRHKAEELHPTIAQIMKEKIPTESTYIKTIEIGNPVISRRKIFQVKWGGRLKKEDVIGKDIDETTIRHSLGMVKMRKHYEKAVQHQMMTWRYLGHKSKPWAWWHPGFPANPILQQVTPHIREELSQALATALTEDISNVLSGIGSS